MVCFEYLSGCYDTGIVLVELGIGHDDTFTPKLSLSMKLSTELLLLQYR